MGYRRKMNRKQSRKSFRKGDRVNRRNTVSVIRRGGIRL